MTAPRQRAGAEAQEEDMAIRNTTRETIHRTPRGVRVTTTHTGTSSSRRPVSGKLETEGSTERVTKTYSHAEWASKEAREQAEVVLLAVGAFVLWIGYAFARWVYLSVNWAHVGYALAALAIIGIPATIAARKTARWRRFAAERRRSRFAKVFGKNWPLDDHSGSLSKFVTRPVSL